MAEPVAVTAETFEGEVVNSPIPVLVDFWAEWCGPCKQIAPVVEKIGERYEGKLKVAKVDIDAHMELADRYAIRSIPTLLLFKDGNVVDKVVGYVPEAALAEHVERVLVEKQ